MERTGNWEGKEVTKIKDERRKKPNTGRKKGEVISKIPKVDFDMDAIEKIKIRKRRVYKKRVNQSNREKR